MYNTYVQDNGLVVKTSSSKPAHKDEYPRYLVSRTKHFLFFFVWQIINGISASVNWEADIMQRGLVPSSS